MILILYVFQDFKALSISNLEILYRLFFDRGISAVFLYRLSRWFYLKKITPLAVLIKHLNIFINHCEVAYQADIGKGFRIMHAIGTVIADCEAGDFFSVYQNVTIGKNKKNVNGRYSPVFGNNVSVYTGAVVTGPITIGDNVAIGANTVVLKDVPNDSKVIGYRPQVIE